ncbi:helix-turn-helix domain-containing protein [Cupriavidus basilensis]
MAAESETGAQADGAAAAPPQVHVRLDGRALPGASELWRAALSPLFDVEIGAASGAFSAELKGVHLGDSLIASVGGSVAHRFKRGSVEIRRSNIDHILIQLYVLGGVQGEYGNRPFHASEGSISLLDLGRTLDSRTPAFSNITLTVPRDRLPASLRSCNLHGTVLDAGQGSTRLLASHLSQLMLAGASLTAQEMAASVTAALIMLEGSGARLRDSEPDVQTAARRSMRKLVRRYIEQHLATEALSPEQVASVFRLSRASLYRLFESDGGVNAFIQGRRLDRCFDELARSKGSGLSIAELAYRYGYSNESTFSRAFRRRFSLSPREVRALAERPRNNWPAASANGSEAATINAWLESLRSEFTAIGAGA